MPRHSISAIAALLVLAGCDAGGSPPIPTAPGPPAPDVWVPPACTDLPDIPTTPDSPVPPDCAVHTVRVLDNAFEPQFLQIAPGDCVRWVLEGRSRHSIIEEDLRLFVRYLEKPGDSFVHQFGQGGRGGYSTSYFCDGHCGGEDMAGCIGVGEPPRCGWN